MGDIIKAPTHYVDGRKYEPKDVIRDWGLNFNLGSAVKYISRAGRKGDKLEDLQKAKQFLEFEIEAEEKANTSELSKKLFENNVNAVLKGTMYVTDFMEPYRKEIINRIVEMIDKGELCYDDISRDLYCGYQVIRDALGRQALRKVGEKENYDIGMTCKEAAEIGDALAKGFREGIVRGYMDGNIHAIGDIDTAPDECKDRLIDYLAQEVLDLQCNITLKIPTDELRKLVIDRIVEMIDNGYFDSVDIPTSSSIYKDFRRIISAIASREYLKKMDGERNSTEDTEDTVSINFEFEVDPEIDADTVNVHVHIKNKEG